VTVTDQVRGSDEPAPPVLWSPDADMLTHSGVARYLRWLADHRGVHLDGYRALWQWSVDDLARFWSSVWDFEAVQASTPPTATLPESAMPGARWFPGARLNYAEHLLRGVEEAARTNRAGAPGEPGETGEQHVALIQVPEDGPVVTVTAGELRRQAGALAARLRALGVGPGDRVVAYLPNTAHAVVGLIACAAIGAVWSVCSPDLGSGGVLGRFAQLEPTVLIAANGYRYGGRDHHRDRDVAEIVAGLPSLSHLIRVELVPGQTPGVALPWQAWDVATAGDEPLEFQQVPFDHPLWVLFSSGTTGRPKGIVQGHGGILLEHLKVVRLHNDVRPGDRFMLVANTSWMVWNVLVSGLLVGGTPVLLDGSATHPEPDRIWRVAAEQEVAVLGLGAGYLQLCRNTGLRPGARFDLAGLRAVMSTGSPLPESGFRWVHDEVGPHVWLSSTSGGTDVCSSFVGGAPIEPVRSGRIQGPCLGVDVHAWDGQGHDVLGQPGELVVTQPMPSMPLRFWNDPDDRRYHDSYFATYPGVWRHGDVIEFDPDGSCVIHGRSDSTLNRKGIRIGPAELYSVVEALPEVAEALVVGAELGEEYYMPLFVALTDGADVEQVRARIVAAIRHELSPRHLPDEIVVVPGVPHTRTGKKLEVPVKRLLQGAAPAQVADPGSIDDPALLDFYAQFAERKRDDAPCEL
jgi:acetoacetyl-CoA synthetase